MAANPNPTRISSAMWRLWEDFHQWEPKSKLGGIYADKAGYHNYRNALPVSDYSRRLSADMRGSGTKASAFDFTMPTAEMKKYTTRLDVAARARDERLYPPGHAPVLREFIGTKNGTDVYCYVLHGGEALGVGADAGPDPGRDSSHLWHLHGSVTREYNEDWNALDGVYSVLIGEPLAEWKERHMAAIDEVLTRTKYIDSRLDAWAKGRETIADGFPAAGTSVWGVVFLKAMSAKQDVTNARLDALMKGVDTIDDKVLAALDAKLDDVESIITAAEAADVARDTALAADVNATPTEVVALLAAVPASEAAETLVASVGTDRARSIATAVLEAVNGVAG
jgi:hypothetical protein